MELHEALNEIALIKRQIAVAEQFRGYRALPVAGGALLALFGAAAQSMLLADPIGDLHAYLALWVSVAAAAGMLSIGDIYWRGRRDNPPLHETLTQMACEQFVPCVAAGGLLTWIVAAYAPEVGWMLPGLWAILFGLGLFASFRLLPKAIFAVAVWYLACGCLWLALGSERAGLAPWTMAITFGCGQTAAAGILFLQSGRGED